MEIFDYFDEEYNNYLDKNGYWDPIMCPVSSKPKEQWLHEGLCYCCSKYGTCDYHPCDAYLNRYKERE